VNIIEAIKELENIRAVVGDEVPVWMQDSSYNELPLKAIKTEAIPFEGGDRQVVLLVSGSHYQDGHISIRF